MYINVDEYCMRKSLKIKSFSVSLCKELKAGSQTPTNVSDHCNNGSR